MKRIATLAAMSLLAAATTVSAQGRQYDPAWPDRTPEWRGDQECFNPRAGHFERVRPGEVQNDLDWNQCRSPGNAYNERPVYNDRPIARGGMYLERRDYRDNRDYRETREECWNPRARHFEEVRRNDYQGDLDFNRCRVARY